MAFVLVAFKKMVARLDVIRSSRIVCFFIPRKIPNDIVSEMYVKTFRWSFFSTLIIFPLYHFFLMGDAFTENLLDAFWDTMAQIVREERNESGGQLNSIIGFFWILICIYATVFFFRRIEKIPYTVYGTHMQRFWLACTFLLFVVGLGFIDKIKSVLEVQSGFTLKYAILLMIMSIIFGFIGVHYVRAYLFVTGCFGIRDVTQSIRHYKGRKI